MIIITISIKYFREGFFNTYYQHNYIKVTITVIIK